MYRLLARLVGGWEMDNEARRGVGRRPPIPHTHAHTHWQVEILNCELPMKLRYESTTSNDMKCDMN